MNPFSGISLKSGVFSSRQQSDLKKYLDYYKSGGYKKSKSFEFVEKDITYLVSGGPKSIYAYVIGGKKTEDGVAWGSDNEALTTALGASNIPIQNEVVFEDNAMYVIHNNTIKLDLKKGDKVKTANGCGIIYSIDNVICVELDDDKIALFEFDRNEVALINDTKVDEVKPIDSTKINKPNKSMKPGYFQDPNMPTYFEYSLSPTNYEFFPRKK